MNNNSNNNKQSTAVSSSLDRISLLIHRRVSEIELHGASSSSSTKKSSSEHASLQRTMTASFAKDMSHSTLKMGKCWLCGEREASPFVALVDDWAAVQQQSSAQLNLQFGKQFQWNQLCVPCFLLGYKTFVQPILAEDPRGRYMQELLEAAHLATKSGTKQRGVVDASVPQTQGEVLQNVLRERVKKVVASGTSSSWACPRCSFLNQSSSSRCEVCLATSPNALRCNHCKQVLDTRGATGPSVCRMMKRPHVIWSCDKCTMINTVDTPDCPTCSTPRVWFCTRCSVPNRARRTVTGERYCVACGTCNADLTASTIIQMGLNPVDIEREQEQQDDLNQHQRRLKTRLARLGLDIIPQKNDGNCQFRALAHQIFNDPELHMLVRHVVCEHLMQFATEEYAPLFGGMSDLLDYVERMRMSSTWGDELTLRAVADAFGTHVNLVTSNDDKRWYIHFSPNPTRGAGPVDLARQGSSSGAFPSSTPPFPNIFLSYLYPVHYDDVHAPLAVPNVVEAFAELYRSIFKAIRGSLTNSSNQGRSPPPLLRPVRINIIDVVPGGENDDASLRPPSPQPDLASANSPSRTRFSYGAEGGAASSFRSASFASPSSPVIIYNSKQEERIDTATAKHTLSQGSSQAHVQAVTASSNPIQSMIFASTSSSSASGRSPLPVNPRKAEEDEGWLQVSVRRIGTTTAPSTTHTPAVMDGSRPDVVDGAGFVHVGRPVENHQRQQHQNQFPQSPTSPMPRGDTSSFVSVTGTTATTTTNNSMMTMVSSSENLPPPPPYSREPPPDHVVIASSPTFPRGAASSASSSTTQPNNNNHSTASFATSAASNNNSANGSANPTPRTLQQQQQQQQPKLHVHMK